MQLRGSTSSKQWRRQRGGANRYYLERSQAVDGFNTLKLGGAV